MNRKDIQVILKGLEDIRAKALSGVKFDTGICSKLDRHCKSVNASELTVWLWSKFGTWSKFSGDKTYPIKGNYEAYSKAVQNDSMFSRTTRYGRLRWNLLNHLIREAKKDLEVTQ